MVTACALLGPASSFAALLQAIADSGAGGVIDSERDGIAEAESFGSRASGRARAEFGLLRAIGQARESEPFPPVTVNGRGVAAWFDEVTIDAPGLAGQQGTATVNYRIDGNLSIDSTARAAANYAFFVQNGALVQHVSRAEYELGGPSSLDFLNRPISATVPIVFGESRDWSFTIQAVGTVFGVSPSAAAFANLDSTATWLGISEVRDAAGNLISDFNVLSGSGTDWAHAVPEASSLSTMIAGLLAILAIAWFRSSQPGGVTRLLRTAVNKSATSQTLTMPTALS